MSGRARLSRSGDFDAVYKKGRSVASRTLVVYTFRHDEDTGDVRLGLAVPRRVGDAVTRNNEDYSIARLYNYVMRSVRRKSPDRLLPGTNLLGLTTEKALGNFNSD